MTGNTDTDFPTTQGAFQTTRSTTTDLAFVAKVDPTGATLLYSTFLGGSLASKAHGIAVDSAGNAYVTGSTDSKDFPVVNAVQPTFASANNSNAFVTKLNATGSALIFSTYLGGSGWDEGAGIAVDSSGNAYVAGHSTSKDFPTTPGAYITAHSDAVCVGLAGVPCDEPFVTKYSPAGSLIYSTFIDNAPANGPSYNIYASGIAVDAAGRAYVVGTGAFTL